MSFLYNAKFPLDLQNLRIDGTIVRNNSTEVHPTMAYTLIDKPAVLSDYSLIFWGGCILFSTVFFLQGYFFNQRHEIARKITIAVAGLFLGNQSLYLRIFRPELTLTQQDIHLHMLSSLFCFMCMLVSYAYIPYYRKPKEVKPVFRKLIHLTFAITSLTGLTALGITVIKVHSSFFA